MENKEKHLTAGRYWVTCPLSASFSTVLRWMSCRRFFRRISQELNLNYAQIVMNLGAIP